MHASNSFKDVSDPCDASESEGYGDGNLGHTALPLIGTLYINKELSYLIPQTLFYSHKQKA